MPDASARQGILPGQPPITISPQIRQLLSYYPLPTIPIGGVVGQVPSVGTQRGAENYFLGRVDYTASPKDSLFVRYVNDRAQFTDPFSITTLASPMRQIQFALKLIF